MEAFYAKDVYNSAEMLQEAIEHSSEDRDKTLDMDLRVIASSC